MIRRFRHKQGFHNGINYAELHDDGKVYVVYTDNTVHLEMGWTMFWRTWLEDGIWVEVPIVSEENCVICELPFLETDARVGAGDGTGQKFAHHICYLREENKTLQAKVGKLIFMIGDIRGLIAKYALNETQLAKDVDEMWVEFANGR